MSKEKCYQVLFDDITDDEISDRLASKYSGQRFYIPVSIIDKNGLVDPKTNKKIKVRETNKIHVIKALSKKIKLIVGHRNVFAS